MRWSVPFFFTGSRREQGGAQWLKTPQVPCSPLVLLKSTPVSFVVAHRLIAGIPSRLTYRFGTAALISVLALFAGYRLEPLVLQLVLLI